MLVSPNRDFAPPSAGVVSVACALLFGLSSVAVVAGAQLAPGSDLGAVEPAPSPAMDPRIDPRVQRAFERDERVAVFLMLRADDAARAHTQAAVVAALGAEFRLSRRYQNISAVAGELTRAGLALVRTHPALSLVQLDGAGTGGLKEAVPAVGVDRVQSERGLSGRGVTVAVLDTGISTQHPALKQALIAQHCFASNACPPNRAGEGQSAEDDHNHGSNVSGIVASRGGGGVAVGYAPGAQLVAVKVLNADNAGRTSDWVAGFDWVYGQLQTLHVKVINASLTSTAEYASADECDRGEAALAAITKKLIDAGVTITASSGNTGHVMTMAAPACNTGVIAVGATYDSDLGQQPERGTYRALGGPVFPACSDVTTSRTTIACFTATAGKRLDLLAPGSQLISAGRGMTMSLFRGTSQAAPGVAGLAALLLECNPALTPARILEILKSTGEPVMDPRSGLSYPLIRGVEAALSACPTGSTGASDAGVSMAGAGAGGSTATAGTSVGNPATASPARDAGASAADPLGSGSGQAGNRGSSVVDAAGGATAAAAPNAAGVAPTASGQTIPAPPPAGRTGAAPSPSQTKTHAGCAVEADVAGRSTGWASLAALLVGLVAAHAHARSRRAPS